MEQPGQRAPSRIAFIRGFLFRMFALISLPESQSNTVHRLPVTSYEPYFYLMAFFVGYECWGLRAVFFSA